MATTDNNTDLLSRRQNFSKVLDGMTVLATDLAGSSPSAETLTKVDQILQQLGIASPNAQDDPDEGDEPEEDNPSAGTPPLTPTQRAAKREAKAFAGAFNNLDATAKSKRRDQKGLWPASGDLSPSFNDNRLLGGRRKKGR